MWLGIADHLGWAVAVTGHPDGRVVDRRRIELVGPGVEPMPVHHGIEDLDDEAAAALLAEVRASAERATAAALEQLAALGPITAIALRHTPPDFPTDLATLRRAPWEARADAVMYRAVLAAAATGRGWTVHHYDARSVEAEVDAALLRAPRHQLGPPWAKDHRVALAAIVTGARRASPGSGGVA